VISKIESRDFSQVLVALAKPLGHYNTIEELVSKTGLERGIIKEALRHFMECRLDIGEDEKRYALRSLPDILLPAVILGGLRSRFMGCEVHCYKTTGSTNEVASRLAESGAPEGTLVVTEKQTRGRGRLGRHWHSPAGLGLYFSIVLRPRLEFSKVPALSLVAALSVCRVLEDLGTPVAQIKWPNDCLLGNKKVAGILVELSAELDRISHAILGIGINVNHDRDDFPVRLRSRATSILLQKGYKVNRPELLRGFLYEFEKSYLNFQRYGLRFLGPELSRRSVVLGKKISVTLGKKKISGEAVGFDENGALRLRIGDEVRIISGGEVTLR
jgi:BirA family biotin operon repressor/biotin-[acetyl-CoA-carboxylase] ligase